MKKVYAEMQNLEVVWKGTSKNKSGKETPLLQCQKQTKDGRLDTFYVGSYKPIDNIIVGDKINAEFAISVYRDEMYLSLMEYHKNGSVAAKKEVRV